jgi:hypothetical protein
LKLQEAIAKNNSDPDGKTNHGTISTLKQNWSF